MCPSGLRSTLGKRVSGQPFRRFESSRFRHKIKIASLLAHFYFQGSTGDEYPLASAIIDTDLKRAALWALFCLLYGMF